MSEWTREITYNCFNDCQMSGCPGHTMRMAYQGASDTAHVTIDGEEFVWLDPSTMGALMTLWKGTP
jgi:hypothetical protein